MLYTDCYLIGQEGLYISVRIVHILKCLCTRPQNITNGVIAKYGAITYNLVVEPEA
jgi:hypothetical protein